jgi:hypothetical protein
MRIHAQKEIEGIVYTVASSQAKMPGTCWGKYRRVALLKHAPGVVPALIRDTRAVSVEKTWEKLHDGTTRRCAFSRALSEALLYVGGLAQ